MNEQLYRVDMPARGRYGSFCCGLIVVDEIVVEAAPIMKWTTGLTIDKVVQWVLKNKGTVWTRS